MLAIKKKDLKNYSEKKIYTWFYWGAEIKEMTLFEALLIKDSDIFGKIEKLKNEKDIIYVCETYDDCLCDMKEKWCWMKKPIEEIKDEIETHKNRYKFWSNVLNIRKEIEKLEG